MTRTDVTSAIVREFPDKKKGDKKGKVKWDYEQLCWGANIMDLIIEDPERANWNTLSFNEHITLNFVEHFITKSWNWRGLSANRCMTLEFIKAHRNKPWCWEKISANDSIPLKKLINHPKCK